MKTDATTQWFLAQYDQFGDAIFRFCCFRTDSRDVAKDTTQETFVRLWEYVAAGKRVQNPKSFIYRIARNVIIDASRKKKASSLDELTSNGIDFGSDEHLKLQSAVEASQTLKVIAQLDDKHRDVIIMRYIDELTPKEIATVTGETENTVSVRLHRAVARVREIFDSLDEQSPHKSTDEHG